MKKLLFTLTFFTFAWALFAQSPNCCTAVPLFAGGPPPPSPVPGPPPNTDDFPCSCIDSETESNWFKFRAVTSGTFEMVIKAEGAEADYDFALFEGDCPCSTSSPMPAVACNSANGAGPPYDFTGIATDPFLSFGVFLMNSPSFELTVNLTEGTEYYLMVDNASGNGVGFTLEFGGTAVIADPIVPPGPVVTGPSVLCPGATASYNAFIFGGVQYSSWQIAYIGQPVFTNNPNVSFTFPTDPGTYFVCVTSFFECGQTQPTCYPVVVAPIPPTVVNDVICYGSPYIADNGQTYFSPGTYNIHYESFYGCDSLIILNLTPAPSEFIVLTEINCEGDCVEFQGETYCETGAYTTVLTNQFGCDSTVIMNFIAVPTDPHIEGADDTLTCLKTSIQLDASMSLGGTDMTYEWYYAGDTIGLGPLLTVTQGGTYTLVTKSLVDGDTCVAEESVTIPTDLAPPAGVTATGGAISCGQETVQLMGNSTTPNVTYAWTGPGGFQSNEKNPTVGQPGNYLLTVTGTNGCTKTATAMVTGSTTPPLAMGTGGTITCLNPTVIIMGSTNVSPATFTWVGPNNSMFSGQNIEVDVAGKYILTVTGANGCTASIAVIVIDDTAPPNADAGEGAALNCFANEAVLNGTGSSSGPSFSYEWTTNNGNITNGANTLTPSVDAAGTYTLTVTDSGNGCTSTDEVSVTLSPAVTASISQSENVSCFGEENGSATATAGGGNGDFEYEWSNGEETTFINGLAAGNYTVTVTDGENCTATATVNISQPALLQAMASATGQTAVGVEDGTASAAPTGGTPGYTYEWSNGETTASINDLAPGNYTVVVTDANGCTAQQSVTVSEFNCLVKVNINATNVTCNGAADGTATVELESAEPPFSFIWSNDETTETIENLPPGTYTVTATDANGCEVVSSVTIMQPAMLSTNATATAETFANGNDGTATAEPTGGTAPYTFEWSNGETTATITGLAPGNYTVTVTDANGCTRIRQVAVLSFGCQLLPTIVSNNVSCNDGADGQATVTLMAGIPPFIYDWSNGSTTATVSNLEAGTYGVTVIDGGGCEVETEVSITEPEAIAIEVSQQTTAECGLQNGSISVEASGGTPSPTSGYTYNWSNGGTGQTISNLAPGTYTVSVADNNDCMETLQVTIGSDDVTPPDALAQDLTLELGANGEVGILPIDVDNGSTDDCAIADMVLDVSSFTCNDLGENEVTLTVTDEGGNSASATAIVTIVDITPPTLLVQDITLPLGPDGTASLTAAMLDNGSFDNCDDLTLTVEPTEFDCDALGENTVTVTATDLAGNSVSEEVTVTVVDDAAPIFDCPLDLNLPYCDAVVIYEISFTDNCSDGLTPTLVEGLPSGSEFPAGETTVTYELTDDSGNSATCSFTVSVTTEMAVAGQSENVTCFGDNDGSISATATGGNPPYTFNWSTPTQTGLPPGTYGLTVTDSDGCTETMTFTITQPPVLGAMLVSIMNETHDNMNGSINVTPQGGTPPYQFVWTDSQGNIISVEEDVSGLSAGTYQLMLTDANGCVSQNAYTIQTTTATSEAELDKYIQLYPNPSSGLVTLDITGLPLATVEVSISDLVGHTFETLRFAGNGKHQLDLSGQPQGVYLVKLVLDDVVLTKRIVVSR